MCVSSRQWVCGYIQCFVWEFVLCLLLHLHSTVICGKYYIQTSVRLTVSVNSPVCELTVGFWIIEIGRKLVEISSVEFEHDRVETPFFISWLGCHRPSLTSSLSFPRLSRRAHRSCGLRTKSSGGTTDTSRGATGFFERTCVLPSENSFSFALRLFRGKLLVKHTVVLFLKDGW